MSCRKKYSYFSKAKNEFIPTPTKVNVNPEIIVQERDDKGRVYGKPSNEYFEEEPKKKKKKYLPGERLLKKLSKVKPKDSTMDRILASFKKQIN